MFVERVLVSVEKYKTPDGVIHDTLQQAENHIRQSGEYIVCPECNGDPWGDGLTSLVCHKCNGDGYIKK